MTTEELELIKQTLATVGAAGTEGFKALVRFQLVDGITSFVGFGALAAFTIWAFRRVLAWKPKDDEAHVPRAAAMIVLSIAMIVWTCGVLDGLRDIVAPEGAAIHSLLKR